VGGRGRGGGGGQKRNRNIERLFLFKISSI
jgi:hypothetical protein